MKRHYYLALSAFGFGWMLCAGLCVSASAMEPVAADKGVEDAAARLLEHAQNEEPLATLLQRIKGIPTDAMALAVHDQAVENPVAYERPNGYLAALRLIGTRAYAECKDDKLKAEYEEELRLKIRAVLLFETETGYVDSDPQSNSSADSKRSRYRGPRTIALRLEAVRALEDLYQPQELPIPFSQEELDTLVHNYNPTEAATSRSDSALKRMPDWTVAERAQVALWAALLHFPADNDAIKLLAAAAQEYRPGVVWREGVLATSVSFYVNEFISAPPEVRTAIVERYSDLYMYGDLPKECPEALRLLDDAFVELFTDARLGSYRYLKAGWQERRDAKEIFSAISRRRQEATIGVCYLTCQLCIARDRHRYSTLEELFNKSLYLRGRWVRRWTLSPEAVQDAAAQLDRISIACTHYLERAVPSFMMNPTVEDKALLIAELVTLYHNTSPSLNDPWFDRSVARLRELILSLDEECLIRQIRQNTLYRRLYLRYRDPTDNSVDLLLLERKFKDPPADLKAAAFADAEKLERTLLAELSRRLAPLFRQGERYRLLTQLGFSSLDVSELIRQERKEAQK